MYSVVAVGFCVVGDGLELCDRRAEFVGELELSPGVRIQPYARPEGRLPLAGDRTTPYVRMAIDLCIVVCILIADHFTWKDLLYMKVCEWKRDLVSITFLSNSNRPKNISFFYLLVTVCSLCRIPCLSTVRTRPKEY